VTLLNGGYSQVIVLRNFLKISGQSLAMAFRVSICAIGVAMLISFPTARAQHFRQHFGTTEVRQNIVRHTFVAGPETVTVEDAAYTDAQPATALLPTILQLANRFRPSEEVADVPTFRIVQHLKLGPTRSGASDPLL
jgi:hypothetical protein